MKLPEVTLIVRISMLGNCEQSYLKIMEWDKLSDSQIPDFLKLYDVIPKSNFTLKLKQAQTLF